MILGEVEETVTSSEIDDETYEEIIKVPLASLPLPRPAGSPAAGWRFNSQMCVCDERSFASVI